MPAPSAAGRPAGRGPGGRAGLVGLALLGLMAAPFWMAHASGLAMGDLLQSGIGGLRTALDAVGWVFVPQLVLAVAVVGLALQQGVYRAAGLPAERTPGWLDPAVESALLLGMLGTVSGMVSGFTGLSPDELEPGPLVHSLGRALRSSFVGFSIALVGVWVKARPGATAAAASGEPT